MNFNWTSEILEDSKPFASALEIFRILQVIPCYVVSLWNNLNICQQLLRTDTWLITVGMLGIYCSILSLLQIITKHFTCTMPPPGMVSSVKKSAGLPSWRRQVHTPTRLPTRVFRKPVILLQIVMVSPRTHLVKNHESQSRTIESQFKKQCVPGSFVTTQLIWGQTPKLCITVYWNKNILLLL